MKRYGIMLWLTVAILVGSCHKHDPYPPKDIWQIKEEVKTIFPLRFKYNNQRLLTQLTMQFVPGAGPNYYFTYDALKRPLTERDSAGGTAFNKYIYQGGRLVRIDKYADSTSVVGQTTFAYDAQGRIILKVGDATYYDYATYEYEGNCRNVKRTSYFSGSPYGRATVAAEASVIEEYTYDNKINPYLTIGKFPVIPFWVSDYWALVKYDPIPENNVVTQKFYGNTDTGYFKYMEYNFNYTYDHNYPVSHTATRTNFNPDGTPGWVQNFNGSYTYDILSW